MNGLMMLATVTPTKGELAMTALTTTVTQCLTWMGSGVTFVTENPICLVGIAIGVIGGTFGLVKGLMH